MWMSFAQCEYSIHTSLGGCEIVQFLVATLGLPDSRLDVRYLFLYSLGQKITTFTIAHRPSRHVGNNVSDK